MKDMPVIAWSGIVKWRTKEPSNYITFPLLVWDDHQIKTEEVEDKCELAEDSNSNACICNELVDLTFCGQSINWHDLSPEGHKPETDEWRD